VRPSRSFSSSYDDTFQKVVSLKETPLAAVDTVEVGQSTHRDSSSVTILCRHSFVGPSPSAPVGSPWALRIHYLKDGQTSGYYHQLRGSNVQVFNTTVMFLKDVDQSNGNNTR
jgi:hypothetical protein